jgi:tetratricopeptide (TPR) repeat protein
MENITNFDYQDAIMLTEEARLIIRKMLQAEDDKENNEIDARQRNAYIRIAHSLYLRALNIQEAVSGWCHEDTARIYYELGWLEYDQTMNFERALAYLLQSLRISHQIYGDDHPATLVVLDDVQDLLEDMDLDNEYVNRVFRSWELQDQAEDIWQDKEQERRDDDDDEAQLSSQFSAVQTTQSPVLDLYHQALDQLPLELDLERALIYRRMASFAASQQRFGEDALSYYCSALMRLPNWVSPDHPEIRAITREARQVTEEQLTPICGRIPTARQQVVRVVQQERDPVPSPWKSRRTHHPSINSWRSSYAISTARIVNEWQHSVRSQHLGPQNSRL